MLHRSETGLGSRQTSAKIGSHLIGETRVTMAGMGVDVADPRQSLVYPTVRGGDQGCRTAGGGRGLYLGTSFWDADKTHE